MFFRPSYTRMRSTSWAFSFGMLIIFSLGFLAFSSHATPARLSFTSLTPSAITTSSAPYDATLTATGTNFTNVNQITFAWSGVVSGSATWNRGDTRWNDRVTINSDTSMILRPRVVESNPTWSGTLTWTVTLSDTTGATASQRFTVTYTPSPKSDLVVEGLLVDPNSGPAGSSVRVSFTIRNQGNGTANASTTNIRLNTSSSNVTTGDRLLASISTPSIGAGGTYTVSQSVTIPNDISPGSYYIWVILDVNSTANQSDESNDRANIPFTVTAPPARSDLIVQNLSVSPTSGWAGSNATVSFTIRNQGNGTANASTTNIRLNTSSSNVTTGDRLLASISTPSIGAGGTYTVSQSVTIPNDISPGSYYIWVILDVNSTANQSDESNDRANIPFTVTAPLEPTTPRADFTWTPSDPKLGQSVQFTNASTGASPLTYSWDFNGDGIADSATQNPTYVFTSSGPYQVTLTVSNAYGRDKVTKVVNVGATASVPTITSVRRQYPGFFLAGSSFNNTFEVTVDWKGTPGTVSFSVNGGPAVFERGTSNGASHTFQMDRDFRPSWSPSTVIIVPTNGEGRKGDAWREYVYVFPYPHWLEIAASKYPIQFTVGDGEVRARFYADFPNPPLAKDGPIHIPDWVPFVGGKFGLGETFGQITAEVSSNGTGSLTLSGQSSFEAMGQSLNVDVSGSGYFRLFAPRGLELTGASFTVGLGGTISKSIGIADAIPIDLPNWGPIRWLNERATLLGKLSPSLQFAANFTQEDGKLRFSEATGDLGLRLSGILQANVINDHLFAKGWVEGNGNVTVGVPDPFMRQLRLGFQTGVEFTADASFSIAGWDIGVGARKRYTFGVGCTWVPNSEINCSKVDSSSQHFIAESSLTEGSVSLIERDYSRFGPYSLFEPVGRLKAASSQIPASVQEVTLIRNIFPGASPTVIEVGNGKLLLWEHQDPALPVPQATDISWSYNDGSSWSSPARIAQDTQMELSPVAAVDRNGKVVAAWLRIKEPAFSAPINTISDLALFYTKLEVVSAIFDPLTRTWGPVTQLTNDTAFDTSLRLSSDGEGNLLLSWLSNPCGELISTATCPSTLKYSFWNGSSWSPPAAVASGLVGVSTHAAAIRGTRAFIVLPRDPNPNVAGDGVLDLFTWNGSSWSTAPLFASGGVENRLASVAYDGGGQGHIVWLRGDDLVHATLSDPRPRVIRPGSRSLGFYSARLLSNRQGNLTLVWQEVTDDGPANIFAMIYDPASQTWSADRRLNQDPWLAHSVSGYYGSDGKLHLVYLATQIEMTNETVVLGGETLTISGNPQDGRTDLRLLEHSLVIDLAVTDDDIRVAPTRPRPGDSVTATVTVHNAGDYPVGNFLVNLYVGNPNAEGVLVGSSRVAGPLRAGAKRILRFSFTYPEGGGNIVAVVDANNDITELTEANNRATFYLDNTAPVVRVVASVTSGPAPLRVNFDASATFDREGDAMSFAWAFSDGSPSASGVTVSHTFTRTGRYPVTVAVTDARGAVGTAIVMITVDAACTYSISPSNRSFPASGGSDDVSVTAPDGCPWQAVSNASWITITSGSNGSGNGTVSYTVAANASATPRTGTMTIAGQTFTVTQEKSSCSYSISPTSQSFGSSGGSGSVSVTAGSGCGWTAVSNAAWITITSGSSGTGSGTVNYSVSANTSTSSRTGTMTIAGQTFTVTQAPASSVPSVPTDLSPGSANPDGSVRITTTPVTLRWNASSSADRYEVIVFYWSGSAWVYHNTYTTSANLLSYSPQVNNTHYAWSVRAGNASGWSDWSSWAYFYFQPSSVPSVPTDLSPGSANPDGSVRITTTPVTLRWNASSSADRYEVIVFYWSGSAWVYHNTYTTSANLLSYSPQVNNTHYAWSVRAGNASGWSDWSSWAYFYFQR